MADTPVLDLLASMTADSIEASSLDPDTLMLVRIAALVAVSVTAPISYIANLEVLGDLEIDPDQVRGVLRRQSLRSSERHAIAARSARSLQGSRSSSRPAEIARKPSRKHEREEARGRVCCLPSANNETRTETKEESWTVTI